ncbi:MAG: SMP-30/gluconolactonase/LRE family protein [Flavobacteriaceae bacterium]
MKKNYFLFIFFFLLLTLTAQNTPPVFTSSSINNINENDTYFYKVLTEDIDSDAISVTATVLPSWLKLATNEVSTFAGSSPVGYADGIGTAAKFENPRGLTMDNSGNIIVVDFGNSAIRKITPSGVVSTLVGASANLRLPFSVAVDKSDNLYVSDTGNNRIRKITPDGNVTTLAGSGVAGFADGTGAAAKFNEPKGIAVDSNGNVYVADSKNHKIRKITPSGVVTTIAGSTQGYDYGATPIQFDRPFDVAVDASGVVYVADTYNNMIRKILTDGSVVTLAGYVSPGSADDMGTNARFLLPTGIDLDAFGNVYVADDINNLIRKISPSGLVTTLAGITSKGYIDGDGLSAKFSSPYDITLDANGNLYVTDYDNTIIRKIKEGVILSGNPQGHLGLFQVVLNADDGTASSQQSFTITVSAALGIEDNVIKGFAMYPNPVEGILNINSQEIIKRLQVYNLLGQQVSDKSFNTANAIIDLRLLPSGTYFVKVTTDKTLKSVKIIKN